MPGAPAPYLAIGHLYFGTVADFQNAFGPHAPQIMADAATYTTVQPTVQISEVMI